MNALLPAPGQGKARARRSVHAGALSFTTLGYATLAAGRKATAERAFDPGTDPL